MRKSVGTLLAFVGVDQKYKDTNFAVQIEDVAMQIYQLMRAAHQMKVGRKGRGRGAGLEL